MPSYQMRQTTNEYKYVRGNNLAETALAAAKYPASGSFIDVRGFEFVTILIHLGTVHASDTPDFKVQCANAANGTPADVDATDLVHAVANDDDGEFVVFEFPVAHLPVDKHFITLDVADVTNGSYGDIIYILRGAHVVPVTQTALLPAASIHHWVS